LKKVCNGHAVTCLCAKNRFNVVTQKLKFYVRSGISFSLALSWLLLVSCEDSSQLSTAQEAKNITQLGDWSISMTGVPNLSSAATEDLASTLDKLNLSQQEIGRFEKAFKDPDFLKLFEDYARDVHDPGTRAETDAYLEQLEQDNRIEQVYGQGTQLIIPSAEFVVKTQRASSSQKVFLNICSSDKVWRTICATKVLFFNGLTLHEIECRISSKPGCSILPYRSVMARDRANKDVSWAIQKWPCHSLGLVHAPIHTSQAKRCCMPVSCMCLALENPSPDSIS
jgi:hypothetical protein